ncbi:TrmH family RNA methyltransferase [Aureivirga sp. CE67]|uniref:TrmH family RNA methyltransferase n=1 Tax=Aureivirga sp. CE67 TaxID=1788983 RepID=UPI0018C98DBE|nr:RNA methyltransferase [Aureivirga sp. CE67]
MVDLDYLKYLEQFVTPERQALFDKVLKDRTRHFTVVLEDLYQKHNTSAVVRSCDIFGVQDVHIIEKKYNSQVSRHVAKGAQKWLDFHQYNSFDEDNTGICIESLREKGYQIIATTPHNDSCFLPKFDITKKSAFVFGVEKEGVSERMMEEADGYLKIPMHGFTESFNISVAAAVILNDVTGRMRASEDLDWKLSEEERLEKKLEWMEKSIKSIDQIKEHYYNNK